MNQVALITGASRGIGYAAAEYFAQQGYDLILIARDAHKLQKAQQTLQSINQTIAIDYHSIDLAKPYEFEAKIDAILQEKGRIDVVLNNAGILITGLLDMTLDDFEKLNKVNVQSAFVLARLAGKMMQQQGSGYILNLASLAGKRGLAGVGGYSSSKFAVVGMSESLYKALAPYNVKVTAICPGMIDTDMTQVFDTPNDEKIQVEDIVATIDYLLKLSTTATMPSIDIQSQSYVINNG